MCELPHFFSLEKRKAKKEHTCCECLGTIYVGEKYIKIWGVWDDPLSFKICLDCDELRSEVDKEETDPEFMTPFEGLWESVFESRDKGLIKRFFDIMIKRKAVIPKNWRYHIE